MRTKFYHGLITIACIALALLALRSNQTARDQAAALDKMTAKVENLQRKTEALEKQLAAGQTLAAPANGMGASREAATPLLPLMPQEQWPNGAVILSRPASPDAPLPPGWKPFEFNGQTHYMIPLASTMPDSAIVPR
jgi:outer membrane murein-binding lipoprotein Lpp